MNAARGRLKSVLHRQLYECVNGLLGFATCELRKDVLWGYFSALNQTESWPLERWAKVHSIQKLLENLEHFEYDDPHPNSTCSDLSCGQDFTIVVRKAIDHTSSLFDGLCLGEMSTTSTRVAMLIASRLYQRHAADHQHEEAVQDPRLC
jgi:hypothetical protein